MGKIVTLKHDSGIERRVKQGFSWTILFFGIIALLVRGQFKESLFLVLFSLLTIPGFIYWIYLMIRGNELLHEKYLLQGFKPTNLSE